MKLTVLSTRLCDRNESTITHRHKQWSLTGAGVLSSWTVLPCHGGTSTRSADPAKHIRLQSHYLHDFPLKQYKLVIDYENITFSSIPHCTQPYYYAGFLKTVTPKSFGPFIQHSVRTS